MKRGVLFELLLLDLEGLMNFVHLASLLKEFSSGRDCFELDVG